MSNVSTLTMEGFYTYNDPATANSGVDDGYMKFDLTYDRFAQTVSGYGSDNAGSFAIDGMYDGYNLRFTKQYYNNGPRWIYSGHAVNNPGNNHFSGTWGDGRIDGGSFTLNIRKKAQPNLPYYCI